MLQVACPSVTRFAITFDKGNPVDGTCKTLIQKGLAEGMPSLPIGLLNPKGCGCASSQWLVAL
jgi:hypothetical protein